MYQDPKVGFENLRTALGKTIATVSFEDDWPSYTITFTDGSKVVFRELGQAGWIAVETK